MLPEYADVHFPNWRMVSFFRRDVGSLERSVAAGTISAEQLLELLLEQFETN